MSTVDRRKPGTTPPPLVAGERLGRAEFHRRYEAMPPGTRAELIGGIVQMPSPLGLDHGDDNVAVVEWLAYYRRRTPGVRATINASTLLDELGEPQPDVSLRILPECGGQTRVEGGYLVGAPELVVELSRSSLAVDVGPKRADYERAGVIDYVVVDLGHRAVRWFVRRECRLVEQSPGEDGLLRSAAFPGLWLDPAALLADDYPRLVAALDAGLATPEHAAFVARLAAGGRPA